MELNIFKGTSGRGYKKIESEFKGTGTKEDPIMIENAEDFSPSMLIRKSQHHLIIKNCKFTSLMVMSSQYITLKDCKIERCIVSNSSDITLKDCKIERCIVNNSSEITIRRCSFDKKFSLGSCSEVNIDLCSFSYLQLFHTHDIFISNCSIKKLSNIASRGNIFKSNDIPETELHKILKSSSSFYKFFFIGFAITLIMLLFSLFISITDFWEGRNIYNKVSIVLLLICMGVIFLTFGIMYYKYTEMKNYPSNEII